MKIELDKLKETQKKIAQKVSVKDSFKISDIKTVAGFDIAYHDKKVICAGVVVDYKTLEVLDKRYTISDEKFPYIPGFLMFREGPPIVETYQELKIQPDVILIDGGGILHPRKSGIASYVGVSLNKPTIGVIKKLLLGEASEGKIYVDKDTIDGKVKELRGERLETKTGARPIFISPGHKISVATSTKIAKNCLVKGRKLPEPLRLAHRYANKAREELVLKEEAQ
ncbi:MAG: endonuclease V [Nanoarchaeota archaeon]|nr:endonuclease V [Nanoarchaeota archaeon]MCG2718884.1 endonuclease V [Nanoarchaeota archaeon]